MTADALNPTVQLANNGQDITMAVQYRPNVQADIHIRLFGPMDVRENTCMVTKQNNTVQVTRPNDVAQTLRPTESITMTCRRTAQNTQINGVAYNCTKETIFNIATSGPVKAIKIPRVCSTTIQESRADQIERKADNALQQITGLKTGTNTALTQLPHFVQGSSHAFDASANVGGHFPGAKVDCDAGYFVAGLETYVESGDGHLKMMLKCWRLPTLALP
jgi:hypothetical protein